MLYDFAWMYTNAHLCQRLHDVWLPQGKALYDHRFNVVMNTFLMLSAAKLTPTRMISTVHTWALVCSVILYHHPAFEQRVSFRTKSTT